MIERVERGADHVVRVRGADRLGDDVIDAERFEEGGWNIRALEREILLSKAYGAAAAPMKTIHTNSRRDSSSLAATPLPKP